MGGGYYEREVYSVPEAPQQPMPQIAARASQAAPASSQQQPTQPQQFSAQSVQVLLKFHIGQFYKTYVYSFSLLLHNGQRWTRL